MCPKCSSRHTRKNGHFRKKQRYECVDCGLNFISKSRKIVLGKVLWKKYIWERQMINQLAKRYKRSEKWIRMQIGKVIVKKPVIRPCSVVIVADTTFIKKTFGICVIRAPHFKKNLIWETVLTEKALHYRKLRWQLEKQGFKLQAAVIDGKPGLIKAFRDIPTQMCHFHQIQIVSRYLTTRPKLPASQTLRCIALQITRSNEEEMKDVLNIWYQEWEDFLKEKTHNPQTNRWFYTHKRLRSAYKSLIKHLPILYTYQKYPELKIPNTTNSLDGSFSHLKDKLRIHRGLKRIKKIKMIDEILIG